MTLDYKKMFLAVTQEAVVKGHFTFLQIDSLTRLKGRFFMPFFA